MGKGNGSTRTSASNSPRGLNGNSLPNEINLGDATEYFRANARLAEVKTQIRDLEDSIEEIEAQKQELFDETDRLGREMANDPENEEYYQNEIMDLDAEIDRLDRERTMARIRIDRLRRENNL